MVLLTELEADRIKDLDGWTDSQCGQINVDYMRVLSQQESDGACCQAICTALIRGKDQWKVGKSKLFLKVRQRHTAPPS